MKREGLGLARRKFTCVHTYPVLHCLIIASKHAVADLSLNTTKTHKKDGLQIGWSGKMGRQKCLYNILSWVSPCAIISSMFCSSFLLRAWPSLAAPCHPSMVLIVLMTSIKRQLPKGKAAEAIIIFNMSKRTPEWSQHLSHETITWTAVVSAVMKMWAWSMCPKCSCSMSFEKSDNENTMALQIPMSKGLDVLRNPGQAGMR